MQGDARGRGRVPSLSIGNVVCNVGNSPDEIIQGVHEKTLPGRPTLVAPRKSRPENDPAQASRQCE